MPGQNPARSETARRSQVVLMAMAAGGRGTLFEPVRIQKLLFLIDREAPGLFGGPHFDFRPHRFGPFDRSVYDELEALSQGGAVRIEVRPSRRTYALTAQGFARGAAVLKELPPEARRYLADLTRWVLALGFGRLLAAIYRRYPEMAVNSVAPEVVDRFARVSLPLPERPFLEGVASAFDLTGALHEPPRRATGFRRDGEALASDWRAVGDDLRAAMAEYATGYSDGV